MEAGEIIIKTKVDNSEFRDDVKDTENMSEDTAKRIEEAQERIRKARERTAEAQKTTAEANESIKQSQEDILQAEREIAQIQQQNITAQRIKEMNSEINKIGKSIQNVTKKVVKWGLAIFGLQGAFSMIRSSMNIISQQDKQLATDIQYMKNAIAYTLEPVVRAIVNLMKQLLQLIGGIIYMWTGKNIFENANKSLGQANKQAGKLKKQLAGFDEMNILSDNSGGEDFTPTFDLTNADAMVKKVEELKNKWFEFGKEMEFTLNLPFNKFTEAFGNWDLAMYGVIQTAHGLWNLITGFGQSTIGLIEIIYGLITGDEKLVKKGTEDLIGGIWKMIKGFVEIFSGLYKIFIGSIKGGILSLIDFIRLKITELINNAPKYIGELWDGITRKSKEKLDFLIAYISAKVIAFGIIAGELIGAGIKFVINGILSWVENKINGFLASINNAISVVNKIPGVNIKSIPYLSLPRLAKGGIVNMPGRGVPVGNAIIGERGAEGVLPLTDSQQMALLGEAIGKYININATVPVYVGNRQIAREIRKINAEDDFAFNG